MPEEAKFKVGDKVVVTDDEFAEHEGLEDGDEFEIVEATYIDVSVATVRFDDKPSRWIYEIRNSFFEGSVETEQIDHA